jgi:hypothetical protein
LIYLIQFAGFGLAYFFSAFLTLDKALVASTVTAIAMSVTSGLSPTLTAINDYPPLPFIWWLSYCRWGAEGLYVVALTGNEQGPRDRLNTMVENKGYNPSNTLPLILSNFQITCPLT